MLPVPLPQCQTWIKVTASGDRLKFEKEYSTLPWRACATAQCVLHVLKASRWRTGIVCAGVGVRWRYLLAPFC